MPESSLKIGASKPFSVWLWAVSASLMLHGVLMTAALRWGNPTPPKPRRVVPVEAITLATFSPGLPGGGGGQPAVTEPAKPRVKKQPPQAVPPPPKPVPKAQAKPRLKTRPHKLKTANKPVQAQTPPPPTLALPRPETATSARFTSLSPQSAGTNSGSNPASACPGSRPGAGSGAGGGAGTGKGLGRGAGQGSSGSVLKAYLVQIRSLLGRQKNYPRMARRQYQEGVVVLRFTICSAGQVEGVGICRSSGHDLLDQAAKETVRRVGCFPPLPRELGRERLTIEIPLAYRLE